MSETEGQHNDSPLVSDRGVTTISDSVVASLAGAAAEEVDGVHMGGGASRTAGGVLGSITGSDSKTSGISVEVGRTEVAIDLKMGIEYNKNILETVEEVRRRITDRVEPITGLRIKELNATITDITFPEKEARRRLGSARPLSEPDESPQEQTTQVEETAEPVQDTAQAETATETTEVEATEPEIAEVETIETETTDAETAEAEAPGSEADVAGAPAEDSGAPEEEAVAEEEAVVVESPPEESPPEEAETVVEERPPEEGQTTELRTEEQVDEPSETTEEVQTPPEPETPEARMRRRAEERARRRRRRTQEDS